MFDRKAWMKEYQKKWYKKNKKKAINKVLKPAPVSPIIINQRRLKRSTMTPLRGAKIIFGTKINKERRDKCSTEPVF